MSQPVAVFELEINDFILSVTTRFYPGDTLQLLDDLTANTISAWLWIVGLLEKNEWDTSVAVDSVEEKYSKDKNIPYEPPLGDARVTVWATWRSNNKFKFHLNSDEKIQDAVLANTAARAGIQKATDKWLEKHPQSTKAGSNQGVADSDKPITQDRPETPKNAVNGVIAATRAPSPATPQYADGQQVSFQINKIVAGSNKGSATFALWGSLGTKYPLVTVYKCKANSTDLNPNYAKIAPVIEKLGLSLDKPEVSGNWYLVCKAAHNNGKEYLNAELLEPISN